MAKESSLRNMVLCLFGICLVCSALLALTYVVTKEPIDAAQVAKINKSISMVVPEFDNVPSEESFTVELDGKVSKVYPAKMGDEIVGYAIEASTSKGFGGAILLMVGFKPDGTIVNTSVISHSETPGLGEKMVHGKSNFALQFNGKNPASFSLSVKKDKGDVDAITASTITSRAYCDAVERGYKVFNAIEK